MDAAALSGWLLLILLPWCSGHYTGGEEGGGGGEGLGVFSAVVPDAR